MSTLLMRIAPACGGTVSARGAVSAPAREEREQALEHALIVHPILTYVSALALTGFGMVAAVAAAVLAFILPIYALAGLL